MSILLENIYTCHFDLSILIIEFNLLNAENLGKKKKNEKKNHTSPTQGFLIQMIIKKYHLPQLTYVYVVQENLPWDLDVISMHMNLT